MCETGRKLEGGLINDTWLTTEHGKQVVVQRVNTDVFTNPEAVMANMVSVTEFIRRKLREEGRNPDRETLTFIPDEKGLYLYCSEDGIFRKSHYISDSYMLYKADNSDSMREAGRLYGDFQRLLSDYPIETLHETIPGFHDTEKRYAKFCKSVENNMAGRREQVRNEIEYLIEMNGLADYFTRHSLPIRVTHNDTKIANLLFDKNTHRALAVIDLETVMPGLSVLDFGDAIRTGANATVEDDSDLDNVYVVKEYYNAFLEGFVKGCDGSLSDREIEELPNGAKVIIYEQALRFLTDYLDGNVYYKTDYPEHNLVRARNQIKLLQSFVDTIG